MSELLEHTLFTPQEIIALSLLCLAALFFLAFIILFITELTGGKDE